MRVLVTGGTGFVGAWTAQALVGAGHQVRYLARNPAGLQTSAATLGLDVSDHVQGDITDADSVGRALEGCDAVVHAAAMVATDDREAEAVHATNLTGAHNVLGIAVERGLDPIVHVSSITALFHPGLERFDAQGDPVGGDDAYGRSKTAVERYARGLQADGHPVTITYPGMVLGPPAGNRFGEVADGVVTVLRTGVVPGSDAWWTVVDVRDVALVHARLLEPGRGPRRYLTGGHHIEAATLTRTLRAVTGRRLVRLPVPGVGLRAVGRVLDLSARVIPWNPVLTEAAMAYYTQMPPADDEPVHRELGVPWRPVEETFADCIAGLVDAGRLSRRAAGPRTLRRTEPAAGSPQGRPPA